MLTLAEQKEGARSAGAQDRFVRHFSVSIGKAKGGSVLSEICCHKYRFFFNSVYISTFIFNHYV